MTNQIYKSGVFTNLQIRGISDIGFTDEPVVQFHLWKIHLLITENK